MATRRAAIGTVGAAAPARIPGRLRFGVLADPQYAPIAPWRTRHYRESLRKLDAAVAHFNGEDLAFVTTLGDVIDRDWESFADILPIYRRLRHPHHLALGNHDYEVDEAFLAWVPDVVGLERTYYDFAVEGWRFLVLDGNDVSLFAPPPGDRRRGVAAERLGRLEAAGAPNAQPWNGSIGEDQLAWIAARLQAADAAGEQVAALCHYPIYPANEHNLWNAEELLALVTAHRSFVAWFSGHNHAGNYGAIGGRHFVNMRAMVDTADETAYAFVEIQGARIEITGIGREESRSLAIG